MTEEDKKDLYNYLFHYNSHKGMWCCFHREDTKHYWNGYGDKVKQVIKGEQVIKETIVGFGESPDVAYSDYKHKQLLDEQSRDSTE